MKQNVSIPVPAFEMENEGWEVTEKKAGANYIHNIEQSQTHVLLCKTFD